MVHIGVNIVIDKYRGEYCGRYIVRYWGEYGGK